LKANITHSIRDDSLFAGIRKPTKSRDEIHHLLKELLKVNNNEIKGNLIHIIRYDTPFDGMDSEVGFYIDKPLVHEHLKSHRLRKLHYLSCFHQGPIDTLIETKRKIYEQLNRSGLSPELEQVEIYHSFDPDDPNKNIIEVQISFLAWPEEYKDQLIRVLGIELANEIWKGGEKITPFSPVDERVLWVAKSIELLKNNSDIDQQFDILSRVALTRPKEDVDKFKSIYESTGDLNEMIRIQDEELRKTRTGGFIDPHWSDGNVLHLSKVSQNQDAYQKAKNHYELRKAYCFCSLIREAENPQVDPIFCYRAAGWARQFWEPILGVEFKQCEITSSILSGDPFCSWEYQLPQKP